MEDFTRPGEYQPATFEGCVVKLADKIAYLGRDIEDARQLGLLEAEEKEILRKLAEKHGLPAINTTILIHDMITDICRNSTPEKGLCFGERYRLLMDDVKKFNVAHIYCHPRLAPFCRYVKLVLEELLCALSDTWAGTDTLSKLVARHRFGSNATLYCDFALWLAAYVTTPIPRPLNQRLVISRYENEKIYGDLSCRKDFLRAVRDYVAGMTDSYAIRMFEELLNLT
jgi:dGTPase